MTRGEEMLALRKARMAAAPPFLRGGFRPFFLAAAVWAAVALMLWLLIFSGYLDLPLGMASLSWHRHEMLFGFAGAAIAGFLLTAVPNWTGRLPIAGAPLALLFLLWLSGRAGLLLSHWIGIPMAAVLDVGFYLTLAIVIGREVVAARNRNLPVVFVVAGLGVAAALDLLGAADAISDGDLGFRFALGLVAILISLIGGRIIPSFTRNWLAQRRVTRGLPVQPTRFDLATVLATGAVLAVWALYPQGMAVGGGLLAVGLLQLVRLLRWAGWRTLSEPIVWILHLGYAWVGIGLVLLGLSCLTDTVVRSAGVHALTAGAAGTMILAVMTRATRGHTGRPISADALTVAVYVAVTVGAAARVAASLGFVDYMSGIVTGGMLWIVAFVLFVLGYAPMLTRRHAVDPTR